MDSTETPAHKGSAGARRKPADRLAAMAVAGGCLFATSVTVQAGDVPSPGCLDGGEKIRVVSVDVHLEPVLEDGRHLRLAGIDLPRDGEWPAKVRAAMTGWLAGRSVLVRSLAVDPDRWNRMPALVFAEAGSERRVSVTEALVEAGLARAAPDVSTAVCWRELAAMEDNARTARRGLWADPLYAAIDAGDMERLSASIGQHVLVEGRIIEVAEARSRLYLRLTTKGRRGLVVAVPPRIATQIAAGGHDKATWRGQAVRVRGFVDNRFGLEIDLTSADQIEFTGGR